MTLFPKPQQFTTRLIQLEKLSGNVYLERFELLEPKEISFVAGQTMMFSIAPGINRVMSIASPPQEKTTLLFVHDISPNGPYSKWAIAAQVGDVMRMTGPLGNFTYKDSPRRKIFVATGTGIAPFHSMIASHITSHVSLYWGLRHEEDIYWQNEFSGIDFHLIISQPSDSWTGKRGHVCEHVLSEEQDLIHCDIYLCGNKDMVKEMRSRLSAINVPKEQVKFELFY